MTYLYSIHDRDAHPHIPADGWCVDAVLVTDDPPNYKLIHPDINWIVRLNHGWAPNGTIPLRAQYPEFAKRCADFAARCPSVQWFIIGNEPNHEQERPHGVKIEPEDYAACFDACYAAIKTLRRDANVCVAAVAPWDVTHGIDWLAYYRRMLAGIDECDSLAIHGYTHGADPNLIWSDETVQGWKWHFPVIYQTIEAIPPRFAAKPVHVTETDQGDNAWLDRNSGWVEQAYKSISDHNREPLNQRILSLALYRWRGDKYELHNKPQVMADFANAVTFDYQSPAVRPQPPRPTPPDPQPPEPTPQPPPDEARRDIDPALLARGVHFEFATVPEGTGYWRIVKAEWLDEDEADAVGPDHHILGTIMRDGGQAGGIPYKITWPSGGTIWESKGDDPNASYNYDYPMSASLNEFAITIADGAPSDKAHGIGMGMMGNPGIHTSTWIDWQWTISTTPEPPIPPPHGQVETGVVTAGAGLNLREGPGTEHAILGTLGRGSTVLYDSEQDGWLHVVEGYVSGEYVGPETFSEVEPPPPPSPSGKLIWPVPKGIGRVTNWFGSREIDYSQWGLESHDGIDIAAPTGTPVLCVGDGVVKRVGRDVDGFGLFVECFHSAHCFYSLYAHLDSQAVTEGQVVSYGQPLGAVGSSGNSSGPHLHLSFRVGDAEGYWRVHTGHKRGASDPMAIYAVVNRSDPNLLI